MKKIPMNAAVPISARGMERRGRSASTPSAAAHLEAVFADLSVNIAGRGWGALIVVAAAVLTSTFAYRSIQLSTRIELALEAPHR